MSKANPKRKNNLFKYSLFGTLYNCGFISTYLSFLAYFTYFYEQDGLSNRKHMVAAMSNFCIYLSFAVVFLVHFETTRHQKTAIEIGNDLYFVDFSLTKFERVDYKREHVTKTQVRFVLFEVMFCLAMIINDFYLIGPEFETFLIYFSSLAINIVFAQYVWVLILLNGMMIKLNNNLKKFSEQFFFEEIFAIDGIKNSRSLITTNKTLVEMKLKLLRDLCLKVQEISMKLNDFYSSIMLGCVSKTFYAIVADAYYVVRPRISSGKINVGSFNDISSFLWFSLNVVSLVIVTHHVTKTTKQVCKLFCDNCTILIIL